MKINISNRQMTRTIRHGGAAAILLAAWGCAWAGPEEPATLGSAQQHTNYSVGYEFGKYLAELQHQGAGVDLARVFRGVLDALSGTQPALSTDQMQAALDKLAKAAANRTKGQAAITARTRGYKDDYAALNAKREGVVVLPSGVQYEVLHAGDGRQPRSADQVAISYEGKLPDGRVFDTTYEDGKPTIMGVDDLVVPGLKEALLLMHEGDKWRVVVPARMGYRNTPLNPLRKRDLIFEIELMKVVASN